MPHLTKKAGRERKKEKKENERDSFRILYMGYQLSIVKIKREERKRERMREFKKNNILDKKVNFRDHTLFILRNIPKHFISIHTIFY